MYAICLDVLDILSQDGVSFVSLGANHGKVELRAVDASSRDVTDSLHPQVQISALRHMQELLEADGIISFASDDPDVTRALQGPEEAYLLAAANLSARLQNTLFQ